jgi:hypothetical protein
MTTEKQMADALRAVLDAFHQGRLVPLDEGSEGYVMGVIEGGEAALASAMANREQKLVDIAFSLVSTVGVYPEPFARMTQEERMDWVARQLHGCGFDTEPRGASWGVLVDTEGPSP